MRHDNDAFATMLLLSQMIAGKEELVKPLTTSEYYALRARVRKYRLGTLGALLDMDMSGMTMKLEITEQEAFRLCMLLSRMLPLSMSMEQFYAHGLDILTLDDKAYPRLLRDRLGDKAPAMLYFAGRTEVLMQPAVGIVGAQPLKGDAENHVRALVRDAAHSGYAVVSEGGTGMSDVVLDEALRCGAFVIACIADSLTERMESGFLAEMVQARRAFAFSLTHPDTPYTLPHALTRNKCIYALSQAVFVFAADNGRGATWDGACEALRNRYCDFVYGWDTPLYEGNRALFARGAKPFGANSPSFGAMRENWVAASAEQLSMFGRSDPYP